MNSARYTCPCCGYRTLENPPGSYDICPVCYWEDDDLQRDDPSYAGGANVSSLMDAQQNYQRYGASEERFVDVVRGVQPGDRRDPDWRPYSVADLGRHIIPIRVIRPGRLRAEMERLGFSIVSQSQHRMVAIRRKRHKMTSFTDVVFVDSVPHLTSAQILADIPRLADEADRLDQTRSRPRGWRQRVMAIVPIYLADSVEPEAADLCRSIQVVSQPGSLFLPVAYDSTTGTTCFRRETDWQALGGSDWGANYYPKLRFVAQRLLEPNLAPEKEPAMDHRIYHRTAKDWAEIFGGD